MSNPKDRKEIIRKLSNFLKLPKAKRWTYCELFYSDIDKVIFESENDFSLCLKQSFPRLKMNKLTRKQWCIVRSLIGKPRRCSDAFFLEERQMLEEKRQKIRLIQQRKFTENDLVDFKDLPNEIPLSLSIGHRVYAHINQPEEGVYLGTIAAVDLIEHTYRVVFDRVSLGSQTICDFDIKSVQSIQTLPIKSYLQNYRPKPTPMVSSQVAALNSLNLFMNTPNKLSFIEMTPNININNILNEDWNALSTNQALRSALLFQPNTDPMLASCSPFSDLNSQFQTPLLTSNLMTNATSTSQISTTTATSALSNGTLGGFPIQLLLMITRFNKILKIKRDYVKQLNEMNSQAETQRADNETLSKEFQMNYAMLVLDLDKLNKDLSDYLSGLQRYCEEYSPEFKSKLKSLNKILTNNEGDHDESKESNENKDKLDNSSMPSDDLIAKLKMYYANESKALVDKFRLIDINGNNKNENKEKDSELTLSSSPMSFEDQVNKLDEQQQAKVCKLNNNQHAIDLIVKFTSILMQIKDFSLNTNEKSAQLDLNANGESDNQHEEENSACGLKFIPYVMQLLNESMNDLKSTLNETNRKLFEEKIQIHLNHAKSTLSQYDKLNAFKYEIDTNLFNAIDIRNEDDNNLLIVTQHNNAATRQNAFYASHHDEEEREDEELREALEDDDEDDDDDDDEQEEKEEDEEELEK